MNAPLFLRRIWQKDNYTFSIQWDDESIQDFRLSDLQRSCPCAHCTDELTGKRLINHEMIADDVKAVFIRSVGRYGLKIQFTSGCSTGIYTFDRLRNKKEEGKNV